MLLRLRATRPEAILLEQRARAEQIVAVIVRYGVADLSSDADGHAWLAQLAGHARPDPQLVALSRGERLCAAAQELGTTFIKIGQILSTRADLVGAEVADALKALQADDPADPPEQIAQTVADALGVGVDEAFSSFGSFEQTPMASASIGQVCRATTTDGQAVVVKVRHTGIVDTVASDVAILQALAQIAERESSRAREYGLSRIVGELVESLEQELDFHHELLNLQVISSNFAGSSQFVFPEPMPELSGEAVLTETALAFSTSASAGGSVKRSEKRSSIFSPRSSVTISRRRRAACSWSRRGRGPSTPICWSGNCPYGRTRTSRPLRRPGSTQTSAVR